MNDRPKWLKDDKKVTEVTFETLSFRTEGNWTVADLNSLVDSVSFLYRVILACQVRCRLEDRYVGTIIENLKRYENFYKEFLVHQVLIERLRLQQEICQVWQRERIPNFDSLASFLSLPFPKEAETHSTPMVFPDQVHVEKLPSHVEILDKLDYYVTNEQALRMQRIEIPTPGVVNFEGIEGVIVEIRHMIQEVWKTHRESRKYSRIEIIEKYLQSNLKLPDVTMPPLPRNIELSTKVEAEIQVLHNLESHGKLRTVDLYIDSFSGGEEESPAEPE